MLAPLNPRSVRRIKSVLSWIAFARRPLKKLELLSAIYFSSGDAEVDHLPPQYMLDICNPLVEERHDTSLLIHDSVKEWVTLASDKSLDG